MIIKSEKGNSNMYLFRCMAWKVKSCFCRGWILFYYTENVYKIYATIRFQIDLDFKLQYSECNIDLLADFNSVIATPLIPIAERSSDSSMKTAAAAAKIDDGKYILQVNNKLSKYPGPKFSKSYNKLK